MQLQVIQRVGHWLLDPFGTAYIVPGFSPDALLALGFWDGAAQKNFNAFWAERFHVAVPDSLVYKMLPGLARLEKEVQRLRQAAGVKDKQANGHKAEAASDYVQVRLSLSLPPSLSRYC